MTDRAHVSVVDVLLAAHREELIAFVTRRVDDQLVAEDIVQQTALRAVANACQLRDPSAGRAWLFRITRTILAEHYRRRRSTESLRRAADEAVDHDEVFACSCVLANLKSLKPEYAEILSRVVLDGVPITNAAGELGISANAATVRVHRAREALKTRLREHCGTDSLRACLDCSCAERGCCTEPG